MPHKIIYGSIAGLFLVTLGLALHNVTSMGAEELIMCSADEGGIKIPSSACEYYMFNHRIDNDDILQLTEGAGLDFILNLDNPKKYKIAETFIARGLNVDGTNNYSDKDITPLHAAVLYNDLERVRFLISQGANTNLVSKGYEMTAFELAKRLHSEDTANNRTEIIKILGAQIEASAH